MVSCCETTRDRDVQVEQLPVIEFVETFATVLVPVDEWLEICPLFDEISPVLQLFLSRHDQKLALKLVSEP